MRSVRRRPLLGLAALVLLLVAVAIASTGAVPAGTGGARRPAAGFVDALISLYLLLMVVGIGLWVYILLIRKDAVAMAISAKARRSPWITFGTLALGFGLLALSIRWLSVDEGMRQRLSQFGSNSANAGNSGKTPKPSGFQPQFASGPVLVVVVLVAIAVLAWYLSYRARRRRLEPMSESLLPVLADVLE